MLDRLQSIRKRPLLPEHEKCWGNSPSGVAPRIRPWQTDPPPPNRSQHRSEIPLPQNRNQTPFPTSLNQILVPSRIRKPPRLVSMHIQYHLARVRPETRRMGSCCRAHSNDPWGTSPKGAMNTGPLPRTIYAVGYPQHPAVTNPCTIQPTRMDRITTRRKNRQCPSRSARWTLCEEIEDPDCVPDPPDTHLWAMMPARAGSVIGVERWARGCISPKARWKAISEFYHRHQARPTISQ